MEKDLKILEEFIKYYEAEATSRKFRGTLSISVDEDDIEAIENLIKGYRELEYKYNRAITDLSIEAKRTNEENYRCSLLAVENNDLKEKLDDSISKSKIKEKIEELEERPNKMVIDKGIPEEYKNLFLDEKAIQVLQELLEDK